MSMLKDAGIWVYKKVRGPVRGVITATGFIELTALGIAKGALLGGLFLLKGLLGIIFGGVLGFIAACILGLTLKYITNKLDAKIAAEDKEFELQIIEEEKNNLDNEISLRAKLKGLREQWAGEFKENIRHGFTYKVTKLSNKITKTFETKIKQLEIKIAGKASLSLQQILQPRNAEETIISMSGDAYIGDEPLILRTVPNTPREEQPAQIILSEQDSSSIAETAFTVTKILAAAGTIFTVAFYGASLGALVCAPIPIVGVPLGYALGAIGGVVLGTVFVFAFGESVSKLKEMTESKKYQQDPEWKAELISFKKEISNTQKSLLELKKTITTQGDIIREGMGQPLKPQDHLNNSANSSSTYTSFGHRNDSDETLSLLADTTITRPEQQNKTALGNAPSDSADNNPPEGLWGWTLHYLYRFGHFVVLTVGGTAAVGTIATCTFYGALMGFKIGIPIPFVGPIGMCIIGGVFGFTVGLIGAYLGVKSCVSVVKDLTDNDQKSCVNDELFHTIDELDKTHDQLLSLEKELDAQLELLESHTPRTRPRGSTNTIKDDLERIDLHGAASSTSPSVPPATITPALPIIPSVTPFRKLLDGTKARTKSALQTTKSIFLKCVCGVSGLAIIGLCAYQGVTLGLALGTVIPGPGNIIGAVTGGLIGAVVGLILVHSAAQGIKKIDRLINGDNVAGTIATVNEKIAENKAIMKNIKEKQKRIDNEAFPAAFDERNKSVWENRADLKDEAANKKRGSDKVAPLERVSVRGTSVHHSVDPASLSKMERIDNSNLLLPPPVTSATDSPPVTSATYLPPVTSATDSPPAQQSQTVNKETRKTSDGASSASAHNSTFFPPKDSAGSASTSSTLTAKGPPTKPPSLAPTSAAAPKSVTGNAPFTATTKVPTPFNASYSKPAAAVKPAATILPPSPPLSAKPAPPPTNSENGKLPPLPNATTNKSAEPSQVRP